MYLGSDFSKYSAFDAFLLVVPHFASLLRLCANLLMLFDTSLGEFTVTMLTFDTNDILD
jgi:hypothetical protein